MATFLTVRHVAANTFHVAANTAGRGCDDPQRDNLCEVGGNFEKFHDVLPNDEVELHKVFLEGICVSYDEGLHRVFLGEDNFGKLHGALPNDNDLCEGGDSSGRLRGVFPLYNQEVLETLKDDNWVALEASRHDSLEVLEAHIQALFLVLREGFIKNAQINEILS